MYFHLSNVARFCIRFISRGLGLGMPSPVSNHVDELDVGVGASNNDLDLKVKMARALDEVWQTCDSTVEDTFQQTKDEDR